jgi:hypothetical protein
MMIRKTQSLGLTYVLRGVTKVILGPIDIQDPSLVKVQAQTESKHAWDRCGVQ